ncbi:MAG: Mrp/NBP35 family ATP-binding protein [Acidimicrobiales bacterium]|nr:Mrp/NBP35 family ATP-binding protein [Acidimicrobiales bacterium]
MSEGSLDDDRILAVLREVMDPELHDNIVDLGMVRSAYQQDQTAHVTIALTTAGCPLRATIKRDCESRVGSLPGIDNVQLHWDELTPAERTRVMDRARSHARASATPTQIPASARVISVASGKGGVGKSTVTVNLASALASKSFTVGILDADIWGFSVPRMLGVDSRLSARPANSGEERGKIIPVELPQASGLIKLVSTGLMVDTEETALMWRGLMLAKALEQFLHDVAWGELDYLLIDMPPGTGDVQMALARLLPQAEMLVITTPALNAQKVAVRVADMARRSHMPVVGVIENMSAFVTPDGISWALFGEGGGQRLADNIGVPLLGSIPLEPAVSSGGDNGRPIALDGGPASQAFQDIASLIVNEISPPINMDECSASSMAEVPVTFRSK